MSDVTMDLDSLVEGAWREFREALADAMEVMEEGDCVHVAADPGDELDDGAAPNVQACRVGDSIVVEVTSNRFLATNQKLTKRGRRHLHELGLCKPTKAAPSYRATYPASHVDQAASVTVSAFRVAFGVVHPAFLLSDDFAWDMDSRLPTTGAIPAASAAIHPDNQAHLDLLVDQALTPMLGHPPLRDSDGDIPFRADSAVVFVRTLGHAPLIRLFAEMVVEISDLDTAVREVDALNREIEGVKFALHGDRVIASADLLALPFAAEHLQVLLAHMCDVVSSHDTALAGRVGGRVFLDRRETVPDAEDEQRDQETIHPVMLCILQLDADKPGSVRPKVAARLCGYDSELLLDLIRWNEKQELAWREARDEAFATDEYDEAEVCEIERAHARRTVTVLRKALRRVLLG